MGWIVAGVLEGVLEGGERVAQKPRAVKLSAFGRSSEEPRRVVAVSVFEGSAACVVASGSGSESSSAS